MEFFNNSSIDSIVRPLNKIVNQLVEASMRYNEEASACIVIAAKASHEAEVAQANSKRATAIASKIENLLGA